MVSPTSYKGEVLGRFESIVHDDRDEGREGGKNQLKG
jgi:hypothetical protein